MSHPLLRVAALAAALLSGLAGSAAAAASASGRANAAKGGEAAAAAPAAIPSAPLTLLNGDRALVTPAPAGGRTIAILRPPGRRPAAALMTLRLGTTTFLIPWDMVPYLGHGLDLSLFDVAALERAERNGRFPVTLRYHGRLHPAPGITVTRAAAGTASGYLTPASAARFAAALARQLASDRTRGAHRIASLFAGRLSINLPGTSPAPGRGRSAFPLHTLTVTGTNPAGQPGSDAAFVDDVDDPGMPGTGLQAFDQGTATFSVPAGTYWAVGLFAQFSGRNIIAVRIDVLPQFTVTGNTTAHTSTTAATSKVTMITPRPAISRTATLSIVRGAPRRSPSGPSSISVTGLDVPLWASPVSQPPGHGTLQAYTEGQLISPPGQRIGYGYTLDFVNPPGIIPPQRFVARRADLATVSGRYMQDLHSTGDWLTEGGTPAQILDTGFGGEFFPLPLPGRQIQYLSAKPAMLWRSQYAEYRSIFPGQTAGGQTAAFRLFRAGQQLTQAWNAYPLHLGSNVVLAGNRAILVRSSAARAGNTLSLDLTPFSDNQAGHTGSGLRSDFPGRRNEFSGSFALYQNGQKIAGGNAVTATIGSGDLHVSAALSPKPSVIKFVVNASRAGRHYRLSASSRDVFTWHSRRQPAATIPAPWMCDFVPVRPSADRHCAVQPLITLGYQVAGMSLVGATRPGRQAVTITAGHIQLAPPSRITAMSAQVSFDGGKTWQRARVRKVGGSRFRANFTAPAKAGISLRVTAHDAGGSSLTETILAAYRTSA